MNRINKERLEIAKQTLNEIYDWLEGLPILGIVGKLFYRFKPTQRKILSPPDNQVGKLSIADINRAILSLKKEAEKNDRPN